MAQQQTTWAKLRDDSWGVRLSHDEGKPGETVTVTRKNGTSSDEVLGTRVAGGPGWSLWTVVQKDKAAPKVERKATAVAPKVRKGWRPCGYPGCRPEHCDECDGEGAGGTGGF